MENRITAAFVILHYKALEDTLKCVSSILEMDDQSHIRVLVIDNASGDGSGQTLSRTYEDNPLVEVIINSDNLGFSKANNAGCSIARDKWDPDFLVVANNDIVFTQKEFLKLIVDTYSRRRFAILGPDITCVRNGVHQSPRAKTIPTLTRARLTVVLNRICYGFFFMTYPLMRVYFHRMRENAVSVADHDKEQEGVLLSGSCVIFSRDYTEYRDRIFDPETFFYSEEALFTLWCQRNEKTVLYCPDIKVMHNESASTYLDKDCRGRIRFQMQNIIASTNIYIKELKSGAKS